MNCVNYVKKTVCMVLMLAFVLISCLGAFATSENPKKLGILASSIKITDTKVEYIEYKDDGAYFVEETISGNIITSDFYKISNGEKIHSSQIISSVSGKNVISRETDANGQVTTYSVKGIVSRDTNEKSIVPYAIRTDNYSISLVGKKVTIASAAMAITLVSNYIPTTGAEDIIKKAIVVVAGAVGAGVACLPDYLYVTSVLSMHKSVGKIYYVYENDYYLDSNKSQLIGHWTFSCLLYTSLRKLPFKLVVTLIDRNICTFFDSLLKSIPNTLKIFSFLGKVKEKLSKDICIENVNHHVTPLKNALSRRGR